MPRFTAWSTGRCAKRTACRSQRARQRQFSPYASGYLLPGKHGFDRFDWEAVSAGTGNVGVRRLQGVVRICRKAAKNAVFFRHISQPCLTPSLCVHWLGVTNQRRVARMKKRSRSHRSQSCCNAKGCEANGNLSWNFDSVFRHSTGRDLRVLWDKGKITML